ncbi:hypothetical protein [Mesorhizobium sp. CN2-181]|uniref:hypothetical protein n=1 Tax=Mesorhizobium yinganensis TaxID=3157707 RepID=UPI0032B85542
MKLDLTQEEAEELLSGLRFRFYQDRTDLEIIRNLAKKIEDAGIQQHGWSPGVWERAKHPPVRVSIRPL